MNSLQSKLDYAESVANYFIELGESCGNDGQLEESLKYTSMAATILCRQNRTLSSAPLEANLRRIAEQLPKPEHLAARQVSRPQGKPTCLHVLTEVHSAGGSSAMAVRWIGKDAERRRHSMAVLTQESTLPAEVKKAVDVSGGRIYLTNPKWSLVEKASWLRRLAGTVANNVILHVAPNDVICGAAFGHDGGPPVLLVNHAAHAFWTGASIADLVINCRGSFLERAWTVSHRGIPRCVTVPIPLDEPALPTSPRLQHDIKNRARAALCIPHNATVIMTVGPRFKYMPTDELDFLSVFEDILQELPEVHLLCVGFKADKRWQAASERLSRRIRCLGVLSPSSLSLVHEAADLYVEGFPFGTTTALLEAGLKNLPVVLAPGLCPPPYASDGIALDATVTRSRTVEDYKSDVSRLAGDRQARTRLAKAVYHSVKAHHTGERWFGYVEEAMEAAPRGHAAYVLGPCSRTPRVLHEYWARFSERWGGVQFSDTLDHSLYGAIHVGLKPRMSAIQRALLEEHRSSCDMVSTRSMAAFVNGVLPVIPAQAAASAFRAYTFLLGRPRLLARAGKKALRVFQQPEVREDWYAEYHKAKSVHAIDCKTE
jgi:hypothetical protein